MDYQGLLREFQEYEAAEMTARFVLAKLERKAAGYTALSTPPELEIDLEKQRCKVAQLKDKVNELKYKVNGNISEPKRLGKSQSRIAKRTARIKRNIIKGYNLDTLIYELCRPIKHKGGAFAFTLEGDRGILNNYVMERICEELPTKTHRPWKRHDITIYTSDLRARKVIIEQRLKAQRICQTLSDLFDKREQEKTDTLLVVWNHEIPLEILSEIAVCCWQDMEQKSQQFLIGKSRCLVVIWANTLAGKSSLNKFTLLPVPHEFEDLEDLAAWFGGELEQLELSDSQKLNEDEIEEYKERIKSHHGHLVGTYTEIQRIIQELQNR